MNRFLKVSVALLFAGSATPLLEAHGGIYRGPGPFPVMPPIYGPGTGGPPGLSPGTPTTSTMPVPSGNLTSWQFWWEYNKDPFLRLKDAVRSVGSIRGSDEFYMSGQASDRLPASLAPTDEQKRDIILPNLKRLLDRTTNKDIATACMVAMAKIGTDHPDFEILPIFLENLARPNQEVRETAALCLGISQRREALDDLLALAADDARGRHLVRKSKVDSRTRAFAVYGLGLCAWAAPEVATKRAVLDALEQIMTDRADDNRDLRVAAIHGISLLRPDPSVTSGKRLLWRCLRTLWTYYQTDIGKGDQVIQAHVPTAIARLLGRGDSPDHDRYKKVLAAELDDGRGRHNAIFQSAALALGKMALPAEEAPDDAVYSDTLVEYAKSGKNQLARFFSLVALGEIGGSRNRSELLTQFQEGKRGTTKPWAGLALGVLAFNQRERTGLDEVDVTLGRTLLQGFREVDNDDHRAAAAVALGLCGYREAVPEMLRQLTKYKKQDMVAGYVCIGLGLMGAEEAAGNIQSLIESSVRRPLLLTQAAIGLGKIGDKEAGALLNRVLKDGDANLAKLAGIATAYRFIGDRRAIQPLCDMMFDDNMTTVSRAFVAAALGGIADKEDMPWNSKISVGTNYHAVVETLTNGVTGVLDIL